jgi:hypothetical protein
MNGEVIGRSENAPLSKLSNISEVLRYRSLVDILMSIYMIVLTDHV